MLTTSGTVPVLYVYYRENNPVMAIESILTSIVKTKKQVSVNSLKVTVTK